MTGPGATIDEVRRMWCARVESQCLNDLQLELPTELTNYPKSILADALAGLTDDVCRSGVGMQRWLDAVVEQGADWLTERRQIEAERQARHERNPTLCPTCRNPLTTETCPCGHRPPWVKAPSRSLTYGDFAQERHPFETGHEAPPDRSAPTHRQRAARAAGRSSSKTTDKEPRLPQEQTPRRFKDLAEVPDGEWWIPPQPKRRR